MKLPSIFKNKETTRHEEWQWPSSCTHPKTQSFRAEESIFKTLNSIYFDPFSGEIETEQESWFSNSDTASFSGTESNNNEEFSLDESMEMIIKGIKLSDRLFFEPEDTNSLILESVEETKESEEEENEELFKESVVMAMESEDPYLDFKKSMEEMVETHGMNDWESMEEMLEWYLKMNGKMNQEFIVRAFVDLMIDFVSSSDDTSFMSASSTMSFSSSVSYSSYQTQRIKFVSS